MHTPPSHRHAFTVVELLFVLAAVFVLIGILLPTLGTASCRNSSQVVAHANLRSLNTGTASYASDHNDEIQFLASAAQAQDILLRATNQRSDLPLTNAHEPILRLRYSHLVLLDYLTDRQPEPIAASPFDKNLIDWQENPLAYLDKKNPFPYGNGFPTKAGYDMDPAWTDPAVMQLWPFGSSYQVVPHAWLNDTDPQYTPSPNSPHHMIPSANTDESTPLGGRKMTEVAQPAAKVFMYEEFDYRSERSPLYASDPNARINLAFFDGSVRQELVSDANSAQDPSNPSRIWQQPYLPLDTFPKPRGGLGDSTPLDLRFRWTKDGLAGIDYGP